MSLIFTLSLLVLSTQTLSRDQDELIQVSAEPTSEPAACPANETDAFFPFPNATYCRNPSITSVCQVPSHKTFKCLTFEKTLIFSSFLAAINQYQGYGFGTARPGKPNEFYPFAFVENNKFESGVSYASTWPNFLVYNSSLLPGIDFLGIVIYRTTPFDLISLTISADMPETIVNFTSAIRGQVNFNYQVGGINNIPSLIVLNWTNINDFVIYTSDDAVLGVDSIVISH
jgi:hypothetical protein